MRSMSGTDCMSEPPLNTAVRAARSVGASTVIAFIMLLQAGAARSDSGPALDFDSLKGKVVYLDFWASWCAPCRHSFPWMDSMQRAYSERGLVVVGVNLDQEHELAERFLREMSPHFRIVFDPNGALAERFKVSGLPASFVIDRHGKVRLKHLGFREDDTTALDAQVTALLSEP